MALRPAYRMHPPDLRAFLSETLWEEPNGSALSVLSAFARLDLDPWQEAGRLAALPRDAAAAELAKALALLPPAELEPVDHLALALRLVEVLPKRYPPRPATRQSQSPAREGRVAMLLLAFAVAFGFLQAIGQLF